MESHHLDSRYVNYCTRHKVQPNADILSSLVKVKNYKAHQRQSRLVVVLDHLKEADFLPLIDLINTMCPSDVDSLDIYNESHCLVNEDLVLSLMSAANQKLHTVILQDLPFTKHFLRDLFRCGLACQVLKLSSSSLQKLDMAGRFTLLHTLNLDFCTSLTSLHKDCFSDMPNLRHLSMCGSRIANLWTTTAAISKLPSLVELRFQNCTCCNDTAPCPAYSSNCPGFQVKKAGFHTCEMIEESFDETVDIYSGHLQNLHLLDLSSTLHHDLSNKLLHLKNKSSNDDDSPQDVHYTPENELTQTPRKVTTRKYITHHPSPICFERHYREFMVVSLPKLKVLDNIPIRGKDKKLAEMVYAKYFEYLPYNNGLEESVTHILHDREISSRSVPRRASLKSKHSLLHKKSPCSFSRSLCAAKLGASPWPLLHHISNFSYISNEESKSLRPRQFEYHPSEPTHMAFGTLDGEVVVMNHENGDILNYLPSVGARNSILGLCWLKNYPSKVLAGSDNGQLRLFDISCASTKGADFNYRSEFITFDKFEQLTSVHTNSTDEQFLVSGYTRNVALYDMGTGKRLHFFSNLHKEPINVAKFAHLSPYLFATSSFDHDVKMWDLRQRMVQPCYTATSSRGNVMVCFSPDDQYLLVSAVDNEVKQLSAVDGRLNIDFGIASSGNSHNYTRSYYMNGRDYIISGSSDEHVVRICCAQTGRRLRDIYFEGRGLEKEMFVQSLRSDPFRPFNMSILASYAKSSSKCEIIKVNLLASSEEGSEDPYSPKLNSSFSLGG